MNYGARALILFCGLSLSSMVAKAQPASSDDTINSAQFPPVTTTLRISPPKPPAGSVSDTPSLPPNATAIMGPAVQPQPARLSREVRLGDVSIIVQETPPRVVSLNVANHPQFHFAGNLVGVIAQISVNDVSLQRVRYEDLFAKTTSKSSLYPVPDTMSVVPTPEPQDGFIIRIADTKFLGSTAYVFCRHVRDGNRTINNCTLDGALTDMVAARVTFNDDKIPPVMWSEFVKSMDDGLHQVVARCEKSLLGERCRH